jgi:hypothetical protein
VAQGKVQGKHFDENDRYPSTHVKQFVLEFNEQDAQGLVQL